MTPLKDQMKYRTVNSSPWWIVVVVPVGLFVLAVGTALLIRWVGNA